MCGSQGAWSVGEREFMHSETFERAAIDLSNWRDLPWSRWSFQNVSEFVPSALIASARRKETPTRALGSFAEIAVEGETGETLPLPRFLEESHSNALVVMRGGDIIAEWYADHCDPARPHIIFSISKSVTGLLAGILESRGMLSFSDPVVTYIPDAEGSAYGDLSLQDLFNMTVAVDFEELYLDQTSDYDRYRRAMLWKPERPDDPTPTLRELVCSLPRAKHPHGGHHAYRSPNADMAGLVVEAAAGERYADFLSKEIWKPMGAFTDAFITVDRAGNPRSSGGISMTARDLARLGELVRIGGGAIIPASFIEQLWAGGDRGVWASGEQGLLFPGGSYRNYWYETGTGALAGLGIHGQSLWIDRQSETVIVRQSSEPAPVNDDLDQLVIAMLKAISAHIP
ncbi:MAG: 6-aminohexanoate-dimer hydrolase [Rhizobiaceae bacterium MnEN-MB40S]|nr:MAG: 6-aminohexanoate-dimer hydrolase [Rhizobiaceae bacterium MnEN-MB40S]